MIGDFVEELANAPSNLATFNLAGAVTGARSFAARFADQEEITIGMHDGTIGQTCRARLVTGTPNQITILQVLENTAGTTNRLNFTGATRVYSRLPASRARGGSVLIRSDVFTSTVGAWSASLPSEFPRFRIEWEDTTAASGALTVFFRLSINGGVSWLQGASDYPQTLLSYNASAATTGGGALSYGTLTPASNNVTFGSLDIQSTGSRSWTANSHGVVGGSLVHTGWQAAGWAGPTPAARATHIMLGAVGTSFAQGRFRLLGIY